MGLGRLGLSPRAFYDATLGEIALAIEEYGKALDYKERCEWERTRWLATVLIQPHAKKGRRIKPEDLVQFEWERPEQKVEYDEERVKRNAAWLEQNSYLRL